MQVQKLAFYQYAPTSATVFDYGRYLEAVPGYGAITSAGSSTTITFNSASALDGAKRPFNDFTVGTIFGVRTGAGATSDLNRVSTVTSDQSIVIASAKDYTTPTTAWWYQKFLLGTTINDGWIFVGDMRTKLIKVIVTALGSTSIRYSIEAKQYNLDQASAQILTGTISSATALANTATVQVPETSAAIRIGLTGVGGPNAADRVNVFINGNPGVAESAN